MNILWQLLKPTYLLSVEGDPAGRGGEPAPEPAPEPSPEPEKFKLDDGEYTAEQIKQWREDSTNKSNWQKELTQKGQEIADIRRVTDFLGNPNVPVEQKWEWFEKYFPKQAKEVTEEVTDPEEAVRRMKSELAEVRKELNTFKQESKQERLDRQAKDVQSQLSSAKEMFKDKWNDEHEDMIKSLWIAKGGTIIGIAKNYFEKLDKLFSSQQKNWMEGKTKDKKNPAFTPKGGTAPSAKSKELTEEERKEAMEQELFGNEE